MMDPEQAAAVILKIEDDRETMVAEYDELIAMLHEAADHPDNAGAILDRAADAEYALSLEVERVEEFAALLGYETSEESEPPGKYRRRTP